MSVLPPGTRLGPYELATVVGEGGMGAVYRARDTRLDRTVAVKVLLASAAGDPEFRDRFEREARAVSALNHPHICALYDVGRDTPQPASAGAAPIEFLVMEFVDGETLATRLSRGALPLADVLTIGAQIAQALDAAHRQGIVHRDLKPGNVMLTKAGVKLLDFGLAKFGGGAGLPTSHPAAATAFAPQPITARGTILGTLQYMAPEQLEGKDADHRADLFALGAIVYEMATGRRAFEAASSASLISAILEKDPAPMSAAQPLTPPALERLVRACLAKDPADRFQNAHDVLLQLRWIAEGGSQAGIAAPVAARRRHHYRAAVIAAGAFLLSTLALGIVHFTETTAVPDAVRFTIDPPPGTIFTPGAGNEVHQQFALSPDGTRIAFIAGPEGGEPQLWVRRLDSVEPTRLAGTEGSRAPFWSPDGRYIGYFVRETRIDRIDPNGGPPSPICRLMAGGWEASWGPNDTILFANGARQGLMRVSASGGTPTTVTTLDTAARDIFHASPIFLPDGRFIYTVLAYGNPARTGIHLASLDAPGSTLILSEVTNPTLYVANGSMLFSRQGVLMTVGFDLKTGRVSGNPVAVTADPGADTHINYSVSQTGRVAHATGPNAKSQLIWYDRTGARAQPIGPIGKLRDPEFSPDGHYLALSYADRETGLDNIWIADLRRGGVLTRLTSGWAVGPLWSGDSTRLTFGAVPKGTLDIMMQAADGSDLPETVLSTPEWNFPADLTRDGHLVYDAVSPTTGWDIMAMSLTGDRKPIPIVTTPFHTRQAQVSPDGRWIAYRSDESTPPDVYVQPFPTGTRRIRITTGGGRWPRWSRDGRELFYIGGDGALTAVSIEVRDGRLTPSEPRQLFKVPMMELNIWHAPYAVSADGRFLINTSLVKVTEPPIIVVLNWRP
jgi:Tol biopolymer transport system component